MANSYNIILVVGILILFSLFFYNEYTYPWEDDTQCLRYEAVNDSEGHLCKISGCVDIDYGDVQVENCTCSKEGRETNFIRYCAVRMNVEKLKEVPNVKNI